VDAKTPQVRQRLVFEFPTSSSRVKCIGGCSSNTLQSRWLTLQWSHAHFPTRWVDEIRDSNMCLGMGSSAVCVIVPGRFWSDNILHRFSQHARSYDRSMETVTKISGIFKHIPDYAPKGVRGTATIVAVCNVSNVYVFRKFEPAQSRNTR
jgi:hypothetical protein